MTTTPDGLGKAMAEVTSKVVDVATANLTATIARLREERDAAEAKGRCEALEEAIPVLVKVAAELSRTGNANLAADVVGLVPKDIRENIRALAQPAETPEKEPCPACGGRGTVPNAGFPNGPGRVTCHVCKGKKRAGK